jgi:glutathione S-transferase
VSALYQRWSGLRAHGPNHLGFDPATRNFARMEAVLDWLDDGGLREGVTLVGVAAACFLLWSDARGGPAWWGRPGLDALVARLAERESFRATEPKLWRPGEAEAL